MKKSQKYLSLITLILFTGHSNLKAEPIPIRATPITTTNSIITNTVPHTNNIRRVIRPIPSPKYKDAPNFDNDNNIIPTKNIIQLPPPLPPTPTLTMPRLAAPPAQPNVPYIDWTYNPTNTNTFFILYSTTNLFSTPVPWSTFSILPAKLGISNYSVETVNTTTQYTVKGNSVFFKGVISNSSGVFPIP